MKRTFLLILIFSIVSLVCPDAYSDISKKDIRFDTVQPASQLATLLRTKIDDINDEIALKTTNKGTGEIFYVDSGVTTAGAGTTWTGAKATLNEAIALCDDNDGDIIYIAQGHTEALDGADGVDLDIAGVTVIGLGSGVDMPEFTYDATNDEFVIGAANVTVVNVRFVAGISNITMGISVEDAGDDFTLYKCIFPKPTTNTFDFADAIDVASGVADIKIIGCEYYADEAGSDTDTDHFIDLGNAALDGVYIADCILRADFVVSAIWSNDADDEVYIINNIITNLTADQHCIEFTGNALGTCAYNIMYTNAEATTLDPGYMKCFENYVTTATDKSGMIIPVHDTGTTQLNATTVTAIATAVDALDGIGMIGLCETNSTNTTVVSAALGGFGNDAFLEGWSLICTFDTGGAVGTAPSGEVRDITDYVSTGGTFTTAAWTAALTAGDYVILIPTCMIPKDYGKIGSKTIYCDDGGSDGEGTNWQNAKITLAKAEAIASVGDTILVGENHNENITTGGDTLNIEGITVIGMGEHASLPLFDFDAAADEITIGAANITLKNLQFRPGATVVVAGIVINSAGSGANIENCNFISGEASGDEFIDCIVVDAAASTVMVDGCIYNNSNATAGDPDTFVNLDAGTVPSPTIQNCKVFGDFDEACVWWGAAVPTNVTIRDNQLSNTRTGQMCIEGTGAATGNCARNVLYADTYGSVLDPGSLKCFENYASNAINTSAYLVPSIDDELAEVGTGRIFYVDSGTPGAGDGRTWATAVATLDAGVNLCTSNDRGDIIYVAAGHTEAVTTAYADLDQGGITVIGLGNGKNQPYFDYTGASGKMTINNDDITVKNLHFHANVDSVLIAIEVETGSENVTIEDCLFTCATSTDEFDVCIDHAAGNHGAVVKNNQFYMGEADAVSAIHFIDADYAVLIDNETFGDYSTACIHNETTAADHIIIADNKLFNGTIAGGTGLNDQPCIELLGTTTGVIVNNSLFTNVTTPNVAIVADDCFLAGNTYSESESTGGSVGVATNRLRTLTTDALGLLGASTGNIFYVDENEATGVEDGLTWETATDTIDEAVNLCTANAGDIILVAPQHTETGGTSFITLDLAGVTIIGLGEGDLRPSFDYDTGSDTIVIAATGDNVTIKNFYFQATVDSVVTAISITGGAVGWTIEDCVFESETGGTDEFDDIIIIGASADRGTVKNCRFLGNVTANSEPQSCINFLSCDNLRIIGNEFFGDRAVAAIENSVTSNNILIKDNLIFVGIIGGNAGLDTKPGISLEAATTGMIVNNTIVCNVARPDLAIVAADCFLAGNTYSENEGAGGGSVPIGLVAGQTYALSWDMATYANDDMFAVAGGPIMITSMTGQIVTAYDGAHTLTLWCDATTAAQDVEWTTSVDIDAYLVGERMVFSAVNPAVITNLTAGATNGGAGQTMSPWFCPIGTIETLIEGNAATAGDTTWYMTFIPLVDGVTVTPQ